MSADKLYVNGSIFTVNKDREWAEAVAVEGNKIVYVETEQERMLFATRIPRYMIWTER